MHYSNAKGTAGILPLCAPAYATCRDSMFAHALPLPPPASYRPWRRRLLNSAAASKLRTSQINFCGAVLDGTYDGEGDVRAALVDAFPEMSYFVGLEMRDDATLCDGSAAIAEQTLAAACMVVELASSSGRTKWSKASGALATLAEEALSSAEELHRALVLITLQQLHRVDLLSTSTPDGGINPKAPQTVAALLAADFQAEVRRSSRDRSSSKGSRPAGIPVEQASSKLGATAAPSVAAPSASGGASFPSYEALGSSERAATLDLLASGFCFKRVCFGEAIDPELRQLLELSNRHGEASVQSLILASCVGELTGELTKGAAAAAGSQASIQLLSHGIETCRTAASRARGGAVGTMSQFIGQSARTLGVDVASGSAQMGLVRLCCMMRGHAEAAGWLRQATARLSSSAWTQLERELEGTVEGDGVGAEVLVASGVGLDDESRPLLLLGAADLLEASVQHALEAGNGATQEVVAALLACLEVLSRLFQLARLSLAPFLTTGFSRRPPYRVQCASLVRIAALQGAAVLHSYEYSVLNQSEDFAQVSIELPPSDNTFYTRDDALLVDDNAGDDNALLSQLRQAIGANPEVETERVLLVQAPGHGDSSDEISLLLIRGLTDLNLVELRGVVASIEPARARGTLVRGTLDALDMEGVPALYSADSASDESIDQLLGTLRKSVRATGYDYLNREPDGEAQQALLKEYEKAAAASLTLVVSTVTTDVATFIRGHGARQPRPRPRSPLFLRRPTRLATLSPTTVPTPIPVAVIAQARSLLRRRDASSSWAAWTQPRSSRPRASSSCPMRRRPTFSSTCHPQPSSSNRVRRRRSSSW